MAPILLLLVLPPPPPLLLLLLLLQLPLGEQSTGEIFIAFKEFLKQNWTFCV
jgi:hypothetical protein